MKVHLAFLAEAAEYSESGNISAVGIVVGRVEVDSLPLGLPRLDFVFSLIFEGTDLGREHEIVVRSVNPAGERFNIESRTIVPAPHVSSTNGIVHTAILRYNLIIFDRAGLYEFQIHVNGDLATSVTFPVYLRTTVEATESQAESPVADTGETNPDAESHRI